MKYLKNHLFLIFALVSILFSIETYMIFNKIVSEYENKIDTKAITKNRWLLRYFIDFFPFYMDMAIWNIKSLW